jgi:glycolate oxidase
VSEFKTIDQILEAARVNLDPGAYTWAASGAGEGATVARNRAALDRLALVPHLLGDAAGRSTATTFLGVDLSMPVIAAPVAALGIYAEDGGLIAARAAAAAGTVAMTSCLVLPSWEDVAATAPGRHFFQLYVFGDRGWTAEVAARVSAAGFAGIAVTIDTPTIGRRDRTVEAEYVWTYPSGGPPNFADLGWDTSFRTRYTWEDLAWLCEETDLPVIAKGVMTGNDARRALDCGVKSIYVSNHGGRQVDHAISTAEVLAEVAEVAGNQADIAVDGGFLRGADACKALALGADVVAIGKLQCWGLAAGGEHGMRQTFEILQAEVSGVMANIGCSRVEDITADHVRWSVYPDGLERP